MKDKIFMFIIGILVGAVLTTGVFFAYTAISSSKCDNTTQQMNGGIPPQMPGGQDNQSSDNNQPPEKPDGDNSQESENNQPPEKPSENNSN